MSDEPETVHEKAVQTEAIDADVAEGAQEASEAVEEPAKEEAVDPAQIALPYPDSDEGNFHEETLLDEEDCRESISIPSSFAAKYIWAASEVSDPSASTPSLPSSVILEARAAIQSALSIEIQASSITNADTSRKLGQDSSFRYDETPPSPPPSFKERLVVNRPMTDEPIVTFFCPYDHTADVIDTLVRDVGASEGCEVLVLDPIVLAQAGDGPLGVDTEKFLKALYDINDELDDNYQLRQAARFLRALVNLKAPSTTPTSPTPNNSSSSPPRIIYLKDFGAVAKLAEPLLRALIGAVRLRRMALIKPSTPRGTFITPDSSEKDESSATKEDYDLLQRTIIVLGVSRSLEWCEKNSHTDCQPCLLKRELEQKKLRENYKYKVQTIPACVTCARLHLGEAMEANDWYKLHKFLPSIRTWQHDAKKEKNVARFITSVLADPSLDVPEKSTYLGDDESLYRRNVYCRSMCLYGFQDIQRSTAVETLSSLPQSQLSKKKKKPTKSQDELWTRNETNVQTNRKREMEALCAAVNERSIRKEIIGLGGIVDAEEDASIFSTVEPVLSEGLSETDVASDSSTVTPSSDASDESVLRDFGVYTKVLSPAIASRIATFAYLASLQDTIPLHSSSDSPSFSAGQPVVKVSSKHVLSALRASVSRDGGVRDWLGQIAKAENTDDLNTTSKDTLVTELRTGDTLNSHESALIGNVIDRTQLKVSFEDVCLDPAIIDNVRTTISFPLRFPKAFSTGILGSEAMSGILLYGPPGTGKTMLCRAVAKECKARMLIISPSDVKDMWLGESEKLCKAIFTLARKLAPCIVFIDEVDAILGARTNSPHASSSHRSMLTEFMTEMDGLHSGALNKKKGVVVIGATNRPFDLDDAILRRLPLRMLVDLPGVRERERILTSFLKDEKVEGVDIGELACRTPNFSGSDLKNLTVSAALASLKDVIGKMQDTTEKANSPKEAKPADDDDADSEDEDEDDETDIEPRVIRPIHFKMAFEQVSATVSSDMDSVRQLRLWSAKYSGKKEAPDASKKHSLSSLSSRSPPTRVNNAKSTESSDADVTSTTKSSEGISDVSNMPLKTYDINSLLARVGSKLKTEIKPE